MVLGDPHHANVSKQTTLLAGIDAAPPNSGLYHMTGNCFSSGIEEHQE